MKIKDIMKFTYLMGTIVACVIVVSCGNEELNEIGQGSVTFNISADHHINESRATVEVPTPDTMILAMLRDVNQVYKSVKVPLSNGVGSPFTQIVSSNTYTFVATNYESRELVYAKNDGRGDCWFYAAEERTVNTGDVLLRIELASAQIGGYYWDRVVLPDGTKGYMVRNYIVETPDVTNCNETVIANTSVNLRNGPGISGTTIITTLIKGQVLTRIETGKYDGGSSEKGRKREEKTQKAGRAGQSPC